MILEHPLREAERMKADFTRVNFGWWECAPGQRPDIIEFGTAKAASRDCPGAFRANGEKMKATPRREDILETLRRWEEARISGFLTEEKKKELRDPRWEHTLLLDEKGDLELVRWEEVEGAAAGNPAVSAFLFRRKGTWGAVLWNNLGAGFLSVPLGRERISYYEELGRDPLGVTQKGEEWLLPLGKKRYLMTNLSKEALRIALEKARYLGGIDNEKEQKNEI